MKKPFNFRPILFCAIFLALGIFCAVAMVAVGVFVPIIAAIIIVLTFGLTALATKKKTVLIYGALFLALFSIGFISLAGQSLFSAKELEGGESYSSFRGTVESVRLLSDESNVYHVVVKDLSGGTVDFKTSKLSLYTKTSGLKKSDVVSGTAKFYKKKYSFDDLYSIENNVSFFASEPIVSLERVRSSFSTSEFVAESVIKAVLNSLNHDEAGVVIALILGRTDYIRKELLSRFRLAGISHIFAVSGLHIGFFYAIVSFLVSLIGIKRWQTAGISVFFALLYALVCSSVSAYRAVIMCFIHGISKSFGKKYDMLNSVFAAMAAILIVFPSELFGAGFCLSFSAVISLALFARQFTEKLLFLPEKLASLFGASIAVVLGTIPSVTIYFGYASVLTVLLNVILLPFISIIYASAFFGSLIAVIFVHANVFLGFAGMAAYVMNAAMTYIDLNRFIITFGGSGSLILIYAFTLVMTTERLNISEKTRKKFYIALPITLLALI